MSKIDEMRRRREEGFAATQKKAATSKERSPAPSAQPPAPAAAEDAKAPSVGRARGKTDEQGKCTGCGKTRAVHDGLVASHQKGLGKMCSGSRKPPA